MGKPKINLLDKKISGFFKRNHIFDLSVSLSYLRGNKTADSDIDFLIEPIKRAHSPLLAAGLASVYKMSCVHYGEDAPRQATGNLQSAEVKYAAG